MTERSRLAKLVKERMARTGEDKLTARRAILQNEQAVRSGGVYVMEPPGFDITPALWAGYNEMNAAASEFITVPWNIKIGPGEVVLALAHPMGNQTLASFTITTALCANGDEERRRFIRQTVEDLGAEINRVGEARIAYHREEGL